MGHVYSALFAARVGQVQLRIEDIDHTRCREHYVQALLDDLHLLGLSVPRVMRQSQRLDAYRQALDQLDAIGVLYPCFCTRTELALAANEGEVWAYPGTCRRLSKTQRHQRMEAGTPYALRLDTQRAQAITGDISFTDAVLGITAVDYAFVGDPVIARKELATSYHLACVVDDATQGVTLVTRGQDLLAACHIQRLLQALLGLPRPQYWHHPLVCDATGRRLAKRKGDESFAQLVARGALTLKAIQDGFEQWWQALPPPVFTP